jgi:hypothetical protein
MRHEARFWIPAWLGPITFLAGMVVGILATGLPIRT